MKIELKDISIRDLYNGFEDKAEDGVIGYFGKLDIRPPYQREFIYKDKQKEAVIDTVLKGFPLNVMYWAVRPDGAFEIIDGQQRTISICKYVEGSFSVKFGGYTNPRAFHNLQENEKEDILNYPLKVYLCYGTPSEKLEWFQTINIAGEKLFPQELKNAVYSGSWVTAAKRHFSKTNCAAYGLGNKYMTGSPIRQDYLETAISWLSSGKIDEYMLTHQNDLNADELWLYFQAVIQWVNTNFTVYRKEMKSVSWGRLYNQFKDDNLNSPDLEKEVAKLMEDEDVTSKRGIYSYVLTRNESDLSIRQFSDKDKREAYERQQGICPTCGKHFAITDMAGDHINPWHAGGRTIAVNCQMLCVKDNLKKAGKVLKDSSI